MHRIFIKAAVRAGDQNKIGPLLKKWLGYRKICASELELDEYALGETTKFGTDTNSNAAPIGRMLMRPLIHNLPALLNKITIVGAGKVGMACAICLLTQNVTNEICLIDVNENKLIGEVKDLQHGSKFLNNPIITGGTNYAITEGSRICIITANARPVKGESQLESLKRNAELYNDIVPNLMKYNPKTILIVSTNPCDVLSYLTWKLSGLPINHVIGTGTSVDTSRLRFLVSQRLGVSPKSCRCWIIGEHGKGFVPVWSTANVAGVRLRELNPKLGLPDDPENWQDMYSQVLKAADEIRLIKGGSTSLALALSTSSLAKNIFANRSDIDTHSTSVRGMFGFKTDIFMSLPCVVNKHGIASVVKLTLTDFEKEQLQLTAEKLSDAQISLGCE